MYHSHHHYSASQAAQSSSALVAEVSRSKKEYYSKRTVENLVAAGLLEPDSSNIGRKRQKAVGFFVKGGVQEISPRRSNVPFPGLKVADHPPQHHLGPARDPTDSSPSLKANVLQGLSPNVHPKELRNEMYATKRSGRRDRTFVGSFCAACEEPLEHTLRGERILQLSCGHVSHEACFYEYIKEFEVQNCPTCDKPLGFDTSRGGNIDFEHLNKLVRIAQTPDLRERSIDATPVPWEHDGHRQPSVVGQPTGAQRAPKTRPSRDHLLPDKVQQHSHRQDPHATPRGSHARNPSDETAAISSNDYPASHHDGGRRHDYDLQSMEASLASPRHTTRNPIPAPLVTVRSEFPTLSKSHQQQSLTCLVTVEVVEGKWRPHPDDLHSPTVSDASPSAEQHQSLSPRPSRSQRQLLGQHVHSAREDRELEEAKNDLFKQVDDWHGLDFERFGKLVLRGLMRVGKDRHSWQELECFLFSEMLICVKHKKVTTNGSQTWEDPDSIKTQTRCALKGSILIKRHLKRVETSPEGNVLTLSLSVVELPSFHLRFNDQHQLETWRRALIDISHPAPAAAVHQDSDYDLSGTDEEEYTCRHNKRLSSVQSSYGATKSQVTAPTEYTHSRAGVKDLRLGTSSLHIPLDIVVVIPVTSSMQGLKISLLRDSLRFLVSSLGMRDRMGLVTFGCGNGSIPVVGMANKTWSGWARALDGIRPVGSKHVRADVVDGANVAMDLLMQRKSSNPLSHILLISDSSTSDPESVDFVVSRAEAAKIGIHSFGLGLTHKPDTMVEMSTRTKASYTYVKDWMMLRECVAGCLGGLQSTSHQNVKVRLRLPEGSPAKFVKISGALHVTKKATGRDAEVSLGDLRFGDKRDVLVQLAIQPDSTTSDAMPADAWENIISGLEALGPMEQEDSRVPSVEELPLIQADLVWGDIMREGTVTQLPRPSLLAITMLPAPSKKQSYRPATPPIPPHPSIVQRRMELLSSDMLTRALSLVARGQSDRAQHLLAETRSILKGLGKGGLPPLPSPPPTGGLPKTPTVGLTPKSIPPESPFPTPPSNAGRLTPSPSQHELSPFSPAAGIDRGAISALDIELEGSLEWICHPTVFGRDTRKSVLQAIGVISSQRGSTFRSSSESIWASRIPGVRRLAERSLEWRDIDDEPLREESEPVPALHDAQARGLTYNNNVMSSAC